MSGKPVAHVGSGVVKGAVVSGSGTVFVGDLGAGTADTCASCAPTTGPPVNPILGCKLLPAEVDFALPAPSVFSFARSYNSGDAREGPLGIGWSIPGAGLSLECSDAATVVVDAEGRRISFGPLLPGEAVFSPTERLWLRRGGAPTTAPTTAAITASTTAPAPWTGRWAAVPAPVQQDANVILVHGGGGYRCFVPTRAPDPASPLPPAGEVHTWHHAADIDAAGYTTRYRWTDDHRMLTAVVDSAGRHYAFMYVRIPGGARAVPDLLRLQGVVLTSGGQPQAKANAGADPADWLVRYRYDDAGNLVAVLDRLGQVVRHFEWTPEHLMAGHGQPGGIAGRYRWAHATHAGAVPGPGRSARVVEQAEADGLTRHYTSRDDHTQVRDSLGRVEAYHFKGTGGLKRWTGHTRADGSQLAFVYDGFGRLISSTDGLGRRTDTRLDAEGRTVGSAGPDGSTWRMTLEEHSGLPLELEDPEGRITTITRDARGNAVRVRTPDGQDMRYCYEHAGLPDRPSHITDVLGKTKQLHYNRLGQLTRYTDCSGHSQHWDYDDEGRLLCSTDALGHATHWQHDALGRPVLQTLPDGITVATRYDGLGRPLEVLTTGAPDHAAEAPHAGTAQQRQQRLQRYQWDRFGRLTQATNPAGHTQRMRYDAAGRLVTLENENGAQTSFEYDLLDRMTQETGLDGRVQAYRYNAGGELVEKVEPMRTGPRITRYAYNKAGRLRERHWPDVQAAPGSPAWFTDTFRWTKTGQLLEANSPDVKVAFEYDKAGQLAMETQTHADGWCYRVKHRHDLQGQEYGVTYGDLPELRWLTYGPGHVHGLRWTPDPAGPELVMDFERDALHREVKRSLVGVPGAFERQRTFDATGRVLAMDTVFTGQAVAAAGVADTTPMAGDWLVRHVYDGLGQFVGMDEWHGAGRVPLMAGAVGSGLALGAAPTSRVRYRYDLSTRLIGSQRLGAGLGAGGVQSVYRFDPAGNRLGLAEGDASLHGARLMDNRLTELDGLRYRYDEAGNMVEKLSSDGVRCVMHYDGLNRMTALQRSGRQGDGQACPGARAGYVYDALMRRVCKRLDAGSSGAGLNALAPNELVIRYGWDGGRLVCDDDGAGLSTGASEYAGAHTVLYEPGGYVPLARVDRAGGGRAQAVSVGLDGVVAGVWPTSADNSAVADALLTQGLQEGSAQPARVALFDTDHLGTPRRLADMDGRTVWQADSDDWGAVKEGRASCAQPIGFQGQWRDEESGLLFNMHRYYDSDAGRYTQSDPIGLAGGINTYSYVGGNPISSVDPDGLCPCGDLVDLIQLARGDKRDWSQAADRSDVNKAFGEDTYKCNLFVDEQYENAGYNLPNVGGMPWNKGKYPPGAGQLSDPDFNLPGWPRVSGPAQAGDLVAHGGHVGIATSPSTTISASPNGKVENNWGFRKGQEGVVIRRCSCGG